MRVATQVSTLVRHLVCVALTAPLLAGCGGGSDGGSGSGGPSPAPHSVSATLPDGLIGTLSEDRAIIPVGGIVFYTMTLTNPTQQPITYQNNQAFYVSDGNIVCGELAVTDPAGKEEGPGRTDSGINPQYPVVVQPGKSLSVTIPIGGQDGSTTLVGQYNTTATFFIDSVTANTSLPYRGTPPLAVQVQ